MSDERNKSDVSTVAELVRTELVPEEKTPFESAESVEAAASQKKKWPLVVVLLALCVVIAIVPLALYNDSEFSGADGEAEGLIEAIAPDYEPWAEPLLEPPGGETESLLFCVQAALGGIVLGYGFGYYYSRKKHHPTLAT